MNRDVIDIVGDILENFDMEGGYPHCGIYYHGDTDSTNYQYVVGPVNDELGVLLEELQEWHDGEQGIDRDIEFVSLDDLGDEGDDSDDK